jgi:hypothetical protein
LKQYVANHAETLDYPAFRAQGLDIGSGPTEALCRTGTARLKGGGGERWNTPNAESLMALAAVKHSGLWDRLWAAPIPTPTDARNGGHTPTAWDAGNPLVEATERGRIAHIAGGDRRRQVIGEMPAYPRKTVEGDAT